jgi:hypothetical protein
MSDIHSIENKLTDLIPSSVSQQGLDQLDATIDRLSQESVITGAADIESGQRNIRAEAQWRSLVQWRMAAVLAILVVSSLAMASLMGVIEVSFKATSADSIVKPKRPIEPVVSRPIILNPDSALSISDGEGTATLTYKEDKPWLRIESTEGNETYDGYINEGGGIAKVPAAWRNRINVDEQSIEISVHADAAEESAAGSQRVRIRYVPNFNRGHAGN